jgi:hypothetical protein
VRAGFQRALADASVANTSTVARDAITEAQATVVLNTTQVLGKASAINIKMPSVWGSSNHSAALAGSDTHSVKTDIELETKIYDSSTTSIGGKTASLHQERSKFSPAKGDIYTSEYSSSPRANEEAEKSSKEIESKTITTQERVEKTLLTDVEEKMTLQTPSDFTSNKTTVIAPFNSSESPQETVAATKEGLNPFTVHTRKHIDAQESKEAVETNDSDTPGFKTDKFDTSGFKRNKFDIPGNKKNKMHVSAGGVRPRPQDDVQRGMAGDAVDQRQHNNESISEADNSADREGGRENGGVVAVQATVADSALEQERKALQEQEQLLRVKPHYV